MIAMVVALTMLAPSAAVMAEDGEDAVRAPSFYIEPGLEYVAIAPAQLARYLGPLIEWKMDRGVPAQIFDLSTILAVYGGRDDAEGLHNFLQDLYYNQTEETPRWLLLAGDPDLVPLRYLWADRDHSGNTERDRNLYVGDTYFSGLGSDWDTDGDGVFGEPGEEDLTPELYVGRISATFPEEMENAVAKNLAYEMDPPGGDWFENAYLAGALMDEPNLLDNPYTLPGRSGSSDEGFDPYTDNAYEVTQKVRAVLGEGYDFIELADYAFFEGCRYTAENDTLNHMSSTAAWNRGNSFVFMASHGYEAFGGLAEYDGSGTANMFESARPFIFSEDTIVNNTGAMLPLVYISSCYSGQYDKEDATNFERMITSPEGGAIALVAGDGDTFRLENISYESFGNWWLSERFWQLVVDEGLVRPGEALGQLKAEYHDYYLTEGPPASDRINMDYFYANLYSYNLQGDPEVPVWVGAPQRLEMEVMGGAVFNSPRFNVRVTDKETGEPVAGATVHARGGGLMGTLEVVTGPDGIATVAPGPSVLGEELRLAVTKTNCVPDRQVLTVGQGAFDVHINDGDLEGPSSVDNLGQVIEFQATVANTGDFTLSSVTVRFNSGDANAPDGEGVDARLLTRSVDLELGEAVTLTFRHRYSGPGQYDVTVRVDPEDEISEASELDNEAIHHLDIIALPSLPGSVGPVQVTAGRVLDPPLDLNGLVEVPDGGENTLTFLLGDVTEGLAAWIDGAGMLFIRPDADRSGTGTIEVMMYREGIMVDSTIVDMIVEGVNSPPVIAPIDDQEVAVGGTLEVALNVSDPDGNTLQVSTSLEGATIEDGRLLWTPGPGDEGDLFPTVVANDMKGGRTEARFRLTVFGQNSVPILLGFDDKMTVEEGEEVQVPVSAVDADGDTLTYYLASPDEGFSIDPISGLVSFDAADVGPGDYTTIVVASDGMASAEHKIEVTVEGSGSVPTLLLLLAGAVMMAVLAAVLMTRR